MMPHRWVTLGPLRFPMRADELHTASVVDSARAPTCTRPLLLRLSGDAWHAQLQDAQALHRPSAHRRHARAAARPVRAPPNSASRSRRAKAPPRHAKRHQRQPDGRQLQRQHERRQRQHKRRQCRQQHRRQQLPRPRRTQLQQRPKQERPIFESPPASHRRGLRGRRLKTRGAV